MGSGDARRHVPALPPVGGNAAGAAYCHHYLVTENCCRKSLALTWTAGYTRPRMVTDAIHPSCRLTHPTTRQPDNPTTRQPDNPTTRQPDNPTTRQPRAPLASLASRSGNRAAADHSAPVLNAPLIRVAYTRHESARLTADEVRPELHQSTPARVATPAGSHAQMGAASDRAPRGAGRHAQVKGGKR